MYELMDMDAAATYDNFPGNNESISDNLCLVFFERGLNFWKAKFTVQVVHDGIPFATQQSHNGNSGVLMKGTNQPFCIKKILSLPGQGTWLVVQHYKPGLSKWEHKNKSKN